MEQLTKNFARSEFACKGGERCCGGSAPISDELVEALQELRDRLARPITVVSGFRCLEYNRRIGSKDTSQHPKGRAADIRVAGMSPVDLREFALDVDTLKRGGVGVYDRFLHVDVRPYRSRWGAHPDDR